MSTDRLARLSQDLQAAADARHMATSPVWARTWDGLEKELLERLLHCGPEDDEPRYRLAQAIEVARKLRRTIESTGLNQAMLEKELDQIEGRKMRSIA